MRRHFEFPPAAMFDHKEAVQRTEAHGGSREEIECRDLFPVVVREGQRLLRSIWLPLRPELPQEARHAGLGEIEAELEQFPVYPGRASAWSLAESASRRIISPKAQVLRASWG